MYNLTKEPRGTYYKRILEYGLKSCSSFLLVVRDQLDLDASGHSLLEKLKPFLIEISKSSKWPGTVLYGSMAKVYRYKYDVISVRILQDEVSSFCEWQQPEMPEDLCLLRPSGEAWLTTIAHEQDLYLTITEDELRALFEFIPTFRGFIQRYKEV